MNEYRDLPPPPGALLTNPLFSSLNAILILATPGGGGDIEACLLALSSFASQQRVARQEGFAT